MRNVRPFGRGAQRVMFAIATLLWGAAARSNADARTHEKVVDLTWTAPAGCPDRESVIAEITPLVSARSSTQTWRARAVIERTSDMWTLLLTTEVEGAANVRQLRAATCAELAHATAVMLAIAVDPARAVAVAEGPNPASSAPLARSAPETPPVREQPRAGRPQARAGAVQSFAGFVVAGGSLGAVASPAFGTGLGVAWLPGRFRFELDGQWFPPSHITGVAQGTGGQFHLLLVGLTGCWSFLPGTIDLGACIGGQGGSVAATGSGSAVAISTSTHTAWAATKAGGLLVWSPTPRFGLRLSADLVVPLLRNRFLILAEGAVHTPAPVGALGLAGVEVRFP